MGWFSKPKEQPKELKKELLLTDFSEMKSLLAQLDEAMKTVEADKARADQAASVVRELMSQLQAATAKKDEAASMLIESQGTAQAIINNIGTIKLNMGL